MLPSEMIRLDDEETLRMLPSYTTCIFNILIALALSNPNIKNTFFEGGIWKCKCHIFTCISIIYWHVLERKYVRIGICLNKPLNTVTCSTHHYHFQTYLSILIVGEPSYDNLHSPYLDQCYNSSIPTRNPPWDAKNLKHDGNTL